MTHTQEQIDALVKAAEMALEHLPTDSSDWAAGALENALTPFHEPEWEYVLPAWVVLLNLGASKLDSYEYCYLPQGEISKMVYNNLRELTKRPKAKNPAT
jgi:hypothetical protein